MRFLVEWIRCAAEARLRVPTGYMTELGEATFSGFIKFVLFLPLARHQGRTERFLLHVARLVTFRHEDCGSCLQGAINVALDEGVSPSSVEAVLEGDHSTMPLVDSSLRNVRILLIIEPLPMRSVPKILAFSRLRYPQPVVRTLCAHLDRQDNTITLR